MSDMIPMGDMPRMGTDIQYSEQYIENDGGGGGMGPSGMPWMWAFILIVAIFLLVQWNERKTAWNATIESNKARADAEAQVKIREAELRNR